MRFRIQYHPEVSLIRCKLTFYNKGQFLEYWEENSFIY